MIDGVKFKCENIEAGSWQNNPLLDFGLYVSDRTGEILKQRKEAEYKHLRFIETPNKDGETTRLVVGSLHKHSNADGNNYNDFSFDQLCNTLNDLSIDFDIKLDKAQIQTLEIGVNIELDYSPEIIFKTAVCHKGKPFDSIDKKSRKFGVICDRTDYAIKLYDKGLQSGIKGKHILRYEIKLHRSRPLEPYNIRTLADLQDVEKVAPLIQILQAHIKETVFFDYSFNTSNLSESKQIKWLQYSNPRYWEALDKRAYYKARKQYKSLIDKYKCIDWQSFLYKKVTQKYNELLDQTPQQQTPSTPEKTEKASRKKGTFSTFKYLMENVPTGRCKAKRKKNEVKEVCKCVSCGRELIGQKKGSRFCSEKIYGKEARKCRNKDSNKRLTIKRKIYRAMENKEQMLLITYQYNGNTYSDTLATSEINLSKEWLDNVVSVECVEPPTNKQLTGKKARKSLKKYLNHN